MKYKPTDSEGKPESELKSKPKSKLKTVRTILDLITEDPEATTS